MMNTFALLALLTSVSVAHPVHHNRPGASVQGVITMKPEPARRVAGRYAGAPAPSVQQDMPAVVFLRGAGLPAPRARTGKPPEMAQHDTAFAPAFLVITSGSSVVFRNLDPFYHNVFSYSKTRRFDLGRFPKPESKTIDFEKAGTVEIFCEIHRSMRAVVLVTENDYHAEVAPDGSYKLADVPAGRYELVVWHADRGQKVVPVTVPASGVVTVNAIL